MRQGAWLVWNKTPLYRARWGPRPHSPTKWEELASLPAKGNVLFTLRPANPLETWTHQWTLYLRHFRASRVEIETEEATVFISNGSSASRKATQRRTYNLECKRVSCQSFLHISYAAVHGILKCIHLYSQSHWITAYLLQVRFFRENEISNKD